jgi:hypothetical protein
MLKRVILAATLIVATISAASAETIPEEKAGIGTFSEGWRMGRIIKSSVKGMITKSTESQMMMGKDSDVWATYSKDSNGNTVTTTKNPWSFSNSKEAYDILSKYEGKYVAVRYVQSQIRAIGSRDTDYTAVEVVPVTKEAPSCTAEGKPEGSYSKGSRTGRIVKVSNKGNFAKTWEMIIHLGGKNFIEMSVTDENVAKCATEWLKSGKEVTVGYSQLMLNISLNDTDYRVYKIAPADDL